jgi:nucleotide-binding universal stress UspA family protein
VTKNIVIAVDIGERTLDALALGRRLTECTHAPARVVTVLGHGAFADPAAPEMAGLREQAGATLAQRAREAGLDDAIADVVPGGSAARELQHMSERPDTGLIVVGSTQRGPIGRLLIGGVGERLLAGGACPVAIAPRGYGDESPAPLARVGVGLDGSEEAQRALQAAVALAESSGAELRIITAVQPLAFGGVTTSALAGTSANDAMRTELRAAHDRALEAARKRVEASGLLGDGTADEVLLAETAGLDLLVVGSRGYGPIGAVLLGSTTAVLARSAACPILVTPRGTQFELFG